MIAVFAVSAAVAWCAAAANLVARLAQAVGNNHQARTGELAEALWSLVPLVTVAWIALAVLIPDHG